MRNFTYIACMVGFVFFTYLAFSESHWLPSISALVALVMASSLDDEKK